MNIKILYVYSYWKIFGKKFRGLILDIIKYKIHLKNSECKFLIKKNIYKPHFFKERQVLWHRINGKSTRGFEKSVPFVSDRKRVTILADAQLNAFFL